MKLLITLLVVLAIHMVASASGYNFPTMRKRQVDMRSFSLYDFPDDYYNAQQEAQRQHYINPKPNYVTAFYPSYDFGRR
ncbi:hypothetical protein CRE_18210 [Caenorhabditis remanei]|uniref:Uncharacterized protein n=1 Tax=Caenorhabditis remanei TaxID=31234 RepID=E3NCH7_CAERE|nr:hypothetical protein CRE_18210 [Caenorhabditis remanei]